MILWKKQQQQLFCRVIITKFKEQRSELCCWYEIRPSFLLCLEHPSSVEHHKLMDFNNMELQVICLSQEPAVVEINCSWHVEMHNHSSCVSWLLWRGKTRLSSGRLCLKPVSKQRHLQSVRNSFTGIIHVILVIVWQLTEETRSHF